MRGLLIKETLALVKNGVREVTLLGQNVNAYNYNGKRLSDLIFEISKINEIKRIRYTTSHPIDFSEDLIDSHKKVCKLMPLIHLPVQSGSDKILKRMNRKHSIQFYLNLIKKLKDANDKIEFSSDFIIGYPGETDQDFVSSIKLLREIKYINTYSFIFSPRPGTPAAKMKKIDDSISKERLITFQKIAKEIKIKYRKNLLNKKSLILFENSINNKSMYFGRDEYSNSVIVKSAENLRGKIREVKIFDGNQGSLYGELVENKNNEEYAA